jgi:uncharacterized repeat protein (TIGR01451 family)
MFSGLSLFRRAEEGNRSRTRPGRRRRRKLLLEKLEDRRLLAIFSESGGTLNLVLEAGENLSILSTPSDTYTFTLTAGGPWSGTDSANVTGQGGNLLTVTPDGKLAFGTINITDFAAAAGVVFADSGGNAYSDNFLIVLDNASTEVTFQGTSSFGTSNLTVATVGNIVLAGVSPVGQLDVSDGNINLSANSAGTASGSFTGIRLAAGSSITSTGTGNISLTGRGAGASADTVGILIEAAAVVRSTSAVAGAGTITLDGTGATGSNNDGVRVSGSNAGVKSVAGVIQITGTAPSSGFGINLQSVDAVQSTGTANIVLIADGVNLAGTSPVVKSDASRVVVRPKTVGTLIDLGGADAAGALGLTDAELDRITAEPLQIGDADSISGAVTVSAAITHLNNLVLATSGGLTFNQQLTVPAIRTLTLRTGAVTSRPGDVVDVQSGTLWLDTQAAVGTADNPLTVAIDNLRGTVGGDLFLREANNVDLVGPLSAGSNTIHLISGQFILAADDLIDDNSRINVNGGTLNLFTWKDTVGGLTLTSGLVSGGGPDPDDGVLASGTAFQVYHGTISAKLAGSVGLNKTTGGTVTLSGDNRYAGPTAITGGVLSINKDICLGTPPISPTPNHLVIDGATLRWTGFLSLSPNRGIGLGGASGTGTIDTVGGLTFNGIIADGGGGPGRLVKIGTAKLTLGGISTYSGGTVVEQGELSINGDRALGAVPAGPVADHLILRGILGATATFTLEANRGIVLGGPSSPVGTITVTTGRTLTYNGVMTDSAGGASSLAKRGFGTLVLGGDNTFSGGTDYADVNSGVIRIDHANGLGATGTIRFPGDGTLRYGPGITIDLSSRIVTGLPTVRTMVDIPAGSDIVFASPLAGGGRFEKLGDGKLSLTYPGTNELFVVFVKGGELAVPTGVLRLTGAASQTIQQATYGPASLLVDDATLSMNGGALRTADSLLIGYLSGVKGRLDVTSGLVHVGGDLLTGDGVFATVNISGASTEVVVTRDFIAGSRGGNPVVNISDGTVRIYDETAQTWGHFTAGNNGSPEVNISGGTVTAGSLRHLDRNNATVNLTGGIVRVDEVYLKTANDVANDSLTVNLKAGGLLLTDRMYLNWTGGTQPLVTHTFTLRFDGGTLKPLSADVINLIDAIIPAPDAGGKLIWEGVIEDGGALIDTNGFNVNLFNANLLRPLVHDPDLVGIRDGGLTKQGAGTLRLIADETFTNTFTGAATVTKGTLALVKSTSNNIIDKAYLIDVQFEASLDGTGLDTGTLILADGQTLMGEGTVTGQLIAASGSTVAPGPGPGILYQVGNYTMNSGSTLEIDIGSDIEGNNSDNHDQMDVQGTVNLEAATLNLSAFNGYVPQDGDVYVIIKNDESDAVTGTFAGFPEGLVITNFLGSGLLARISYQDDENENATIKNDVVIRTFLPAAIGGRVWVDLDGDGIQGPVESGLGGVAVTLTGADAWDNPVNLMRTTNANGTYLFNDQLLLPGMYTVTVTNPGGYLFSPQNQGQDDTLDSDVDGSGVAAAVLVGSGVRNLTVDAGLVPQIPAIELSKDGTLVLGDDGIATPGDLINYTFTVTNTGNTALVNVTLSDSLPGLTFGALSDLGGDGVSVLAPGAVETAGGTYAITQADINAGLVDNTATVDGQGPQGQPARANAQHREPVPQVTTIDLAKLGTLNLGGDGRATPGDLINYTFTVTNTGNTTLSNVTLSDSLPGLTFAALSDLGGDGVSVLAPGAVETVGGTYAITQADINAGLVDNTATVDGQGPQGQPAGDSAQHREPVPQVTTIDLDKAGTLNLGGDGRATPGDLITYTFTVINTGNTTLSNVTFSDSLPGLTFGLLSDLGGDGVAVLAPGAVETADGTYAITQADIDAGLVDNTATVNGFDPQGNLVAKNDSHREPVPQVTTIDLAKVGTLNLGGDGRATPGDLINYTFTVTNTGNTTLSNVTLSDSLPGLAFGVLSDLGGDGVSVLAPGAVETADGTYVIIQADIDAGLVDNTATVNGFDPQGNLVAKNDSHREPVPQVTTIALAKVGTLNPGGDGRATPGDLINYTFTVTNTGNTTLSNVTLSDSLPGLTFAAFSDLGGDGVSVLAPGAVETAGGTYAITQADINAGLVNNTATVYGQDPQGVPAAAIARHSQPLPQTSPIFVLGPDKTPAVPQLVRVVDLDGVARPGFSAYGTAYTGGTRVAVANLDGVGDLEIITAPGRNLPGTIAVWTLDGDPVQGFPSFLAYDSSYIGGVELTVADVNGDGRPDIITVPSYGASEVRVFYNQYDPLTPSQPAFKPVPNISFQAFPVATTGGAVVAAADMGRWVDGGFVNDPDGKAEVVVGTGGGVTTAVSVFDVSGPTERRVQTFYPFDGQSLNLKIGVSLDVGWIAQDSVPGVDPPEIIVGMGTNGTSGIEVWTWDPDASLIKLGAIPLAFAAPYDNAPVRVAAMDADGNGISEAIYAVQGPIGAYGEVHRFEITSTSPFAYQPEESLSGFPGPWFIATPKTVVSVQHSEPDPNPAAASTVWTNPVDPLDVNDDGLGSPLDVLVTINHINANPGQTSLPLEQFTPARFFDTNVDGMITPGDVLLVLNYLNSSAAGSGEGEASEPADEIAAIFSSWDLVASPVVPRSSASTPEERRDQVLGALGTVDIPGAKWFLPEVETESPRIPHSSQTSLDEFDLFDLESVLEEMTAELAAS